MTTSDRLRAARLRKGLTQEELARELGVSLRTLGKWENGEIPETGAAWKVITNWLLEEAQGRLEKARRRPTGHPRK